MPPPRPATSTSTENLLLKCQKETRKKCLPPEWSLHPPNQPSHPPTDTLALAIQIDASSPSAVTFYESSSGRLVGSIGPEYRGSIVIVPWRPGLKFVCQSTCRRRAGCRVGVVREAKGKGMGLRMKSIGAGAGAGARTATRIPVKRSSTVAMLKKRDAAAGNAPLAATPSVASHVSNFGYNHSSRQSSGDKSPASSKHVSFDDKSISGKSPIKTDGGGSPKPRSRIPVKSKPRC